MRYDKCLAILSISVSIEIMNPYSDYYVYHYCYYTIIVIIIMYVFCVLYEMKATQMTYTDRITRCDKGLTNYDNSPLLIYI